MRSASPTRGALGYEAGRPSPSATNRNKNVKNGIAQVFFLYEKKKGPVFAKTK